MHPIQHRRHLHLLPMLIGGMLAAGLLLSVACKARQSAPGSNGIGNGTDSFNRPLNLGNDTLPANRGTGSNADDPFRPRPGNNGRGNTASPFNGPTTNRPQTAPNVEPGPIELTADEQMRERMAGLVMQYRWPQGMYPFGLRAALPGADDEGNVLWQMIYRAHAAHRRGLYEQAEGYLLFAMEQEKTADHYLVAFNLGACRQMMVSDEHPEKLEEAVEGFRACLSLRLPMDEEGAVWTRTSFRHFSAGALAQIEMERGNRRLAMDYALESAFTWTPIDYLTGKALEKDHAADRLLQSLYDYGNDSIGRETKGNLFLLLTRMRPELSGQTSEDLLADFWSSCVRGRTAENDIPDDGSPICYSKKFLQTFIQRWLDDYPESDRRPGLLHLARSTGLTE